MSRHHSLSLTHRQRTAYEHRPLTEQERADLVAAMARYELATKCWSGWLFGETTGTPEARHAAWLEASQASHAAEAILIRIRDARKNDQHDQHDGKGRDDG